MGCRLHEWFSHDDDRFENIFKGSLRFLDFFLQIDNTENIIIIQAIDLSIINQNGFQINNNSYPIAGPKTRVYN